MREASDLSATSNLTKHTQTTGLQDANALPIPISKTKISYLSI